MPLTPKQLSLVQATLEKVAPIADKAAESFYARLFEIAPHVRPLFGKADMKSQGKKLMDMISVAVKGLGRLDKIAPAVRELGRGHVAYGVKDEHYDLVGQALLWALEKGLAQDFTPETREAWAAAYAVLAATMKDAARQLPAPAASAAAAATASATAAVRN